ncbi:MAG: glycosyltransferase family 4 protein, partial [Anaerolineaceae bacterium]|nr:glycosyltransferase family 4 protein [Anaerolineaceae bacterium]
TQNQQWLLENRQKSEKNVLSLFKSMSICHLRPALYEICQSSRLSSRWEGLPLVLLEAMGMGAAVIGTGIESIQEVVRNHENGEVVQVEDAESLAISLKQLLSDEEMRRRLGTAAQNTIKSTYTVDAMCEQYAGLLNPNQQ